ncbi:MULTISPECIES: glutamine--tRNA ligase [unclassified Pseudoalteromonas]|jgi:glutaminyl-tRNA synthetase|uniref:glutamine--tRNA ligase n=1 Tax=unclassified Pseudoalteromonas TaxID=194690 RepID=UPI0006D630F1|nr:MULTISPECIES: glutamine--tRNA ligase [unclassified Pseudoalteromonas]MDC9520745.1 glutamine--tRNA ligase [Pseudoalteromonas sp. Angola-31]KPV92726.1 Glutamine--tRNA ligase [Pseudoalteromonas sp. P1-30]MDC9502387.1 glutamine--tRNA ligase [Pseudoalteromonas sp. Angola-18]MDC9528045.1 glutamine--tRNA ligase [Pseudoalteromonas sp. Angola-7]TMP15340.1 glutamine--tRNA ligase [Pseudoalteromonas sp. S2893]|tara:strand:- start:3273 stop:4937 length:1665 start_codon:yes stop_codon:yes gene_type:complete
MAEIENRPSNFIRTRIDEDLASGKHATTHTRFPPEPNGFLHIGHAKSICLNFGIAKDYDGLCNLRFDDTNPEKEDINYVNSIKEDVQWLGFNWSGEIKYSSNYFDTLYGYAVELIEKGLAYVCFLTADQAREYRGTLKEPGKNSPYRDTSVEENLALFEKMRAGEFKEGECVLRAKIDMASSFMVLRDPIIYRVRFAHHHQTGDKWCIYPMYDFTHCISDALEGITHSLCTLEFQDNRRLYDWVLDNISLECHPQQIEFSRLNLEYTIMSKRKLNDLVVNNYVEGWDDPRMPTIAGLRRRGYTPASIREFCLRIGVTKQENMVEMGMLEACIREDLNENAPRAMAVLDPVKVVIENFDADKVETLSVANHPNKEEMGRREVPFTRELFIEREDFREEANNKFKRLVLDKEVRLRGAYVIKAQRVEKDENGEITTIYCTYDNETLGKNPSDGRKVKGVIHWVSAPESVNAEVRLYDRLFNVPNPGAAEEFESTLNPDSLVVLENAKLEASLAKAEPAQGFQFERTGYFSRDTKSENLVFNQTVGLRDSWAKIEKQ